MAKTRGFEDLIVYQLSVQLSDAIWDLALPWDHFSRSTVGAQIVLPEFNRT
jgi:hypothetical protein